MQSRLSPPNAQRYAVFQHAATALRRHAARWSLMTPAAKYGMRFVRLPEYFQRAKRKRRPQYMRAADAELHARKRGTFRQAESSS